MKLDIWKVSTLVFGGALALVVGYGGVRETSACDMEEAPPSRSAVLLKAAASSLGRADAQLKAVDADRGGHRAKALGHLALALDEVEKGIIAAESPAPTPRPKPRRPMGGGTNAKVALDESK
jgi:hypothetical protein